MGNENERVVAGLICDRDLAKIREAVCIQTEKIFDSCREKDCIENARVILCPENQALVNTANAARCRKVSLLDVKTDIEPVPFKRGFFTVDVTYFFIVVVDLFTNASTTPVPVTGVVIFNKKVILFGSEGNVKIFKTHFEETCNGMVPNSSIQQDNLPTAKIEVAEPICLNARILDIHDRLYEDFNLENLPAKVLEAITSDEHTRGGTTSPVAATRRLLVTIGIFSIIKLVRLVQLLIPAFDYCVPNKECISGTEQDPCQLFETIEFPIEEFFPPQIADFPGAVEAEEEMIKELQEQQHEHHDHHR